VSSSTETTDPPPSRLRAFLRSRTTWAAGVASAVVAALLIAWLPGEGRNLVDRVIAADPVRFLLIDGPYESDVAVEHPIDDPADRAALLTEPDRFPALVAKYGGGPVGRLDIVIVAEGGRSQTRIVDIRPRVLKTLPLLTGTYFHPVTAGQGDVIALQANLDGTDRLLRGTDRKPYFTAKQILLNRGEQETLRLSFTAAKAAYEFELVATIVADGRRYEQVVRRPDGAGFRVTGAARDHRRYPRVYVGGGTTWRLGGRADKCEIFPRSKGC
jgi:hypothetical protein